MRHAGPGAVATVRVRESRRRLLVEISDSGGGSVATTLVQGSGITGMRQRAESLGGSVDVVLAPGRGVQVTARLPLQPSSPVERA